MSFNDAITNREAQTGAFYFPLGGEERVKIFFHMLLMYSLPGIFNCHFNGGIKSLGANGQYSASGARFIGVLQEV